jgi:hypothetical protein
METTPVITKHPLSNGFTIEKKVVDCNTHNLINFFLYKDEVYAGTIETALFEDNIVVLNCLGLCEERAYCQPHEIIKEEDHSAVNVMKEYIEGRKIVEQKSGWVTKTQYWKEWRMDITEEEAKILKLKP